MISNTIEPSLIRIFRYFVIFQWILLVLELCGDDARNSLFAQLQIFPTSLLLVYLTIPRLQNGLGRWYLPLALTLASLPPIITLYSVVAQTIEPGILIIWLFVPMVLTSAQYKLRHIILFNIVTSGLELILAGLVNADSDLVLPNLVVRILLFGMVGYIVLRLMEAQRAQQTELAIANAKLAELASTQEQLVISRERNRMAQDLHDVLAHTLTAVSIQLNALKILIDTDPLAAQKTLDTLQDLTHEGLTETRHALKALRSNPVNDLGLNLALKNLAQTTSERKELHLSLTLPSEDVLLPMLYQQNIYRVAEEALINIVRHAQSTELAVTLRIADRIELEIQDNGVGFDMNTASEGHYGLIGMQERALLCQGKLMIVSILGQGTTVRLIIEGRQR